MIYKARSPSALVIEVHRVRHEAPSLDELRSRLERRGEDSAEVIEVRLQNAATEMAQCREFDFVIINELFERALFDLKAIVHSQRLKYVSQRRARADTFQALRI